MSRFENNALTATVQTGDFAAVATNLFRTVVQLPEKTISLLHTWQTRIDERQHIRSLSDAQLKDIGWTRTEADREANKSILIP